MKAHHKMLIGIVTGTVAGLGANALAGGAPWLDWAVNNVASPVGQIFIRLLLMLVVPLLFAALVMGVAELDLRQVGRLGARTLGYTVVFSAISVLIGLVLVNVIQPGHGLSEEARALARGGTQVKAAPPPSETSFGAVLMSMVPTNPLKAAADGDMIGLIVFSLIFGLGVALTPTEGVQRLKETLQGLYDVMMKLIDGVLRLAPYGVGALLFAMTARLGLGILQQLAAYVGTVLLALSVHMFIVYSLSVRFLGGRNPIEFFRDCRLAIVTAFSTSSSSATLPTALKVAEENLKLPPNVSRFVLTAGSAMNQNGTALFEGVTVLFLAQVYEVPLDLSQQALIMFICILAGIGTAGVPAGSIPVIAMILTMFKIPVEGLGLVLGVDRFLDMCRTTLNVTGDLAAAVYVARGEPPARTDVERAAGPSTS
ncbi:dicarboxylate/amino acid:cation symporter [Myxococcus sp. MISCRS1]|jgi:DAACS family dicarboxylate/amino acid:cation (Na+ or H+) symporter|uniref:dicarboxylate/amino acid:cation symporter n=1 Tax=Myxococcus TaxID=32 RepID=UPI001CBAEE7C|nr:MULTISPECIES: dicarboxylate/amino acid:cation symporter [unclassified Myxococcus]MBZ4397089.1 dicarboxylate/amino acid:cation symporter [Myxococcus sp. AS-1-15]MCY0996702.1 dicarboxylate/amino acid:cation symporter [Myxococcus sp. MISCRS1]BDT33283.1 dicarboxylate/amino acid:cation symporter [Myxococcus sp. MH1]